MAVINSSERLLGTLVYLMLILAGDVELNPGPTLNDKPTKPELISLCKAGEQKPHIRVKKAIAACENYQDLADILLGSDHDDTIKKIKKSCPESDQFVDEMFRKWLELDDDDLNDSAVPRTWGSLAHSIGQADLPGSLAKSIRDVCSTYESKAPAAASPTPPKDQKSAPAVLGTRKKATSNTIMKKLQDIKFPEHLWISLAGGLELGGQVESIQHETMMYPTNKSKLNKIISILTAQVEEEKIWKMLVQAVHASGEPLKAKELAQDPEVDVHCP